jgi:predicted PurR-regulated permease PerM
MEVMHPLSHWVRNERPLFLLARVLLFTGACFGLLWLLGQLHAVVLPMAIAAVVAYMIQPVADWLERLKFKRPVAIGLILFAIVSGLSLFALLLLPRIIGDVFNLAKKFPDYLAVIQNEWLPVVSEKLQIDIKVDYLVWLRELGEDARSVAPEIVGTVGNFLGTVFSSALSVSYFCLNWVLVIYFTFYFARDFTKYTKKIRELIPPRYIKDTQIIFSEMDRAIGEYLRGQFTVCSILAVLYSTGLSLIGVELGLLIGLLAGFANAIPYMGITVGMSLSMLMVFLNFAGAGTALKVAIWFSIVQFIEGYFITPHLVGDRIGISAVVVVIAVMAGASVAGLVGVMLAIPLAAIINILVKHVSAYYLKSEFFNRDALADAVKDTTIESQR